MLDQVLPYVIIFASISLCFFLMITAVYSIPYYQKKINLKKSKEIIEENRQKVEDATFFVRNKEYQKVIEEQLDQIRSNAAKIKSLNAEIDDIEYQKKKEKKK